jgi:hypothetical protein
VIVRPFITAGSFHPARNAPLRGAQNPPPMAQRGPNGGGSPHGRACRWVAQRSVEAASPHPVPGRRHLDQRYGPPPGSEGQRPIGAKEWQRGAGRGIRGGGSRER